jgi:hypothetical protein
LDQLRATPAVPHPRLPSLFFFWQKKNLLQRFPIPGCHLSQLGKNSPSARIYARSTPRAHLDSPWAPPRVTGVFLCLRLWKSLGARRRGAACARFGRGGRWSALLPSIPASTPRSRLIGDPPAELIPPRATRRPHEARRGSLLVRGEDRRPRGGRRGGLQEARRGGLLGF